MYFLLWDRDIKMFEKHQHQLPLETQQIDKWPLEIDTADGGVRSPKENDVAHISLYSLSIQFFKKGKMREKQKAKKSL